MKSNEPLNDVNDGRAISSEVERTVHIGDVAGSTPASPTTNIPPA